jgi:hypothetical protein
LVVRSGTLHVAGDKGHRGSRARLWLFVASCLVGGLGPLVRSAAAFELPVVGGALDVTHPTVGALLLGDDPDSAQPQCTAVLVGCQTVVTAAHCFCGVDISGPDCQDSLLADPDGHLVFFPHAGFTFITNVTIHPDYDFQGDPGSAVADLAVLTLVSPVTGIPPSPVSGDALASGTAATLVGFGQTDLQANDRGLERSGAVTTGTCPAHTSHDLDCWSFSGAGVTACDGDAGAPLFVGPAVAALDLGVTNFCVPPSTAFALDVSRYASWIANQAGEDLGAARCDPMLQIGETGVLVQGVSGSLDPGTPSALYSFGVPPGAQTLRIALNAQDPLDGSRNVDFYAHPGAPPSGTEDDDCFSDGPGQFGYCEVPIPLSGTWWVLVQQASGSGTFQLTVTSFGGEPAVCGNGIHEPGEQCDGTDLGECPIGCSAQCTCAGCIDGALDLGQVELTPRFFLRGLLRGADSLDPRRADLAVTATDDSGAATGATIPAGDRGWRARGRTYRWRGNAGGLRKVVVRHRKRGWIVTVDGRGLPGADAFASSGLPGLRIKLFVDRSCAEQAFGRE